MSPIESKDMRPAIVDVNSIPKETTGSPICPCESDVVPDGGSKCGQKEPNLVNAANQTSRSNERKGRAFTKSLAHSYLAEEMGVEQADEKVANDIDSIGNSTKLDCEITSESQHNVEKIPDSAQHDAEPIDNDELLTKFDCEIKLEVKQKVENIQDSAKHDVEHHTNANDNGSNKMQLDCSMSPSSKDSKVEGIPEIISKVVENLVLEVEKITEDDVQDDLMNESNTAQFLPTYPIAPNSYKARYQFQARLDNEEHKDISGGFETPSPELFRPRDKKTRQRHKLKKMTNIKQKLYRLHRNSTKKGKLHFHVKVISEPRVNLEKRNIHFFTNIFRVILLFIVLYAPGIMAHALEGLTEDYKTPGEIVARYASENIDKKGKRAKKEIERVLNYSLKRIRGKNLKSTNYIFGNAKKIRRNIRKLNKTFPTHIFSAIFRELERYVRPESTVISPNLSCKNHDDDVITSSQMNVTETPEVDLFAPPTTNIKDETRRSSRQEPPQPQPRQVVSDTPGRTSDDIRDPPGQQSVYIPPGDVRKESYRLSTFEHFPVTCPISRKYLSKSGFYFTGFFDRVKCFACGRTVERWEGSDNPANLAWHK